MPYWQIFHEAGIVMDKELKQELEWINENLKAVVTNQDMLYCRIRDIEDEIKKQDKH
jgi:hypothetical protein